MTPDAEDTEGAVASDLTKGGARGVEADANHCDPS